MKFESNIICPHCNNINESVKIPETMWLMRYECQSCHKTIVGRENPHGWTWVFCSYGDVPWLHVQEQEEKSKLEKNQWNR